MTRGKKDQPDAAASRAKSAAEGGEKRFEGDDAERMFNAAAAGTAEPGTESGAQTQQPQEGTADAAGYELPPQITAQPGGIAGADRVLARAETLRSRLPAEVAANLNANRAATRATERDAINHSVVRNYANEAFVADMIDGGDEVLDMMQDMTQLLVQRVTEDQFREFKTEAEYAVFMKNPIVIRIHETRDKNEPPLVFMGVNGSQRWVPRNKNVRMQRYFIERLAQAQEMAFKTDLNADTTVDNAMITTRRKAASYTFSVLHDPHPVGRRWLERVTREGV